jgi:hypothetical protein
MSKEDIRAWAALMDVSQSYIHQELRRERNLSRARKDPENWVVLKFPNTGEIHAFSKDMFPIEAGA